MANTIEKARKYAQLQVPNGYKFNVKKYLYEFSMGNEYPAFIKEINRDENYIYYRQVYFFKHYDGTASIYAENYSMAINGDAWQIINKNPSYKEEIIEELPKGTRFNVKLLFNHCV